MWITISVEKIDKIMTLNTIYSVVHEYKNLLTHILGIVVI